MLKHQGAEIWPSVIKASPTGQQARRWSFPPSILAFEGRSPKFISGVLALTVFWFYRALGVVPAFLLEIFPPARRSTFPGVTYELGNMVTLASDRIQFGRHSFLQSLDCVYLSSIHSYR